MAFGDDGFFDLGFGLFTAFGAGIELEECALRTFSQFITAALSMRAEASETFQAMGLNGCDEGAFSDGIFSPFEQSLF